MLASLPRIVEPEVIIPHSHQVNTNASMQASWDSMHLQPTAYTPSRTSPIPIQRHSSHRAHPYKLPSGSPSGRSARHSPATPSPQLLRAASYPLASNSYAMSQPIQYPTTDLIRPQPPVAPPLPRRVRISQNFAGRSPSRRSLKVDFHANGVPGFRVGDALYNEANLHIDNGEDIVWANCVDRYAHLSINVSKTSVALSSLILTYIFMQFPGRSGDHGAYLYTAHVDPDTKVRRAWTRKALAVETAKAILRAYVRCLSRSFQHLSELIRRLCLHSTERTT